MLNIYIDKVRMKCLLMFCKTCGEKMTFELLGETVGEDEDVL
jgi:RNase P subunit RPR2